MLLEVIKQDKFLTWTIALVAFLWFVVFIRNMWLMNQKAAEFQQTYEQILSAEEYKVKGKFEQ